MAKKTVEQKIAELVDEQTREADEWLRKIVTTQDGKPNATDLAYARQLGWDTSMLAGTDRNRKSLLRELHRMTNVVNDQLIAGTSEERDVMAYELEKANEEVALKTPAIDEKIAALQRERFALVQKPKQLERRLEEARGAVQRLRENLPVELRQSAQDKLNELYASDLYRDVRSMKSRVDMIEKLLVIPSTSEQALLHARSMRDQEQLLEKTEQGWEVNGGLWSRYLDSRRKELAELKAELPILEAKVNEALIFAQAEFDYYAR